jgi:hypothetical protein
MFKGGGTVLKLERGDRKDPAAKLCVGVPYTNPHWANVLICGVIACQTLF